MSAITYEQPVEHPGQPGTHVLPELIQEKLGSVIEKNRRTKLVRKLAVIASFGLLALAAFLVADHLVGIRWTPLRWLLWLTSLCTLSVAIRSCWLQRKGQREHLLLKAAWQIEASYPEMEERLASTVQFLECKTGRKDISPQLLSALVTEANQGAKHINAESLPGRSNWLPLSVAALLAAALISAASFWPESVLTSLRNLATPWETYALPALSVTITPGDVIVSEGDSLEISAIGEGLAAPTLEILRGDVVESHAMLMASSQQFTHTVENAKQNASYRVHSNGLYSPQYSITVRPHPRLETLNARLVFPEYTQLAPMELEQVVHPMEVPAGTEVVLTATANPTAVEAAIQWQSESPSVIGTKSTSEATPDSVQFEWAFHIEPEVDLVGKLHLHSQHGLASAPHPLRIRGMADAGPNIEITAPNLSQLTISRDSELPLRYRVTDDYGISSVELMLQFAKDKLVAQPCQPPEADPRNHRLWIGTESLKLSDLPADCTEFALWLRSKDNRPEKFGGSQSCESQAIRIKLQDSAESLGEQQILADTQFLARALQEAMQQLQSASKSADALLARDGDPSERGAPSETPEETESSAQAESRRTQEANALPRKSTEPIRNHEHIAALREQTQRAKNTLEQLAADLKGGSKLFEPKAVAIEHVAEEEVTEALELASQIPLVDTPEQQKNLAGKSQQQLKGAIAELESLKKDIEHESELMQKAAELDELASQQERLAKDAAANDQSAAPEDAWRERQRKVADELQTIVEKDEDAERKQLRMPAKANPMRQQQENPEQASAREQLQEDQRMNVPEQNEQPTEARDGKQSQAGSENREMPSERQAAEKQRENLSPDRENAPPNTDREQLLRQAARAEQLAKEAQQLAEQQKHLADALDLAMEENKQGGEAQQELQKLINAQRKDIQQHEQKRDQQSNDVGQQDEASQQRQRLDEASEAAEQGNLDQAAAKVQEQIKARAEQLRQQAEQLAEKELADTPATRPAKQAANEMKQAKQLTEQAQQTLCEQCKGGGEHSVAAKPSRQKQNNPDAERNARELRREQTDAANSLRQAAQSFKQVCNSCRECAHPNGRSSAPKPQGANQQGPDSSRKGSELRSKQLSEVSKKAKQAASAPSNKTAAKDSAAAAKQLNELADQAAEESGFSLRKPQGSPQKEGKQTGEKEQSGTSSKSDKQQHSGQSTDAGGVGNAPGETNLNRQRVRGSSSSNWTRSQRTLSGGVLDDREGKVPEKYREAVERYFEQLSRQQSNAKES